MRQTLSALLGVVLMCLPLAANAAVYGDFTYESDGMVVAITGYTGTGGDIIIPDSILGLPVARISNDAFASRATLTSVVIPDSVVDIGAVAFFGCTGLTSLTLPPNLTSIGSSAFDCCTGLTGITLPASLTSIGGYAFYACTRLQSITIPASVSSIGDCAFSACNSLTAINVLAGNTAYRSHNGALYDLSQTTLIQYPAGKSGIISIPGGVIEIKDYSFEGCSGLTSVTLPGSVNGVGTRAFFNCSSLARVLFEGSAPGVVGSNVFEGAPQVIVYYLQGASGWGSSFSDRPVAEWVPDPPPPAPPAPEPYVCGPEGDIVLLDVGSYDGYFYGYRAFGGGAPTAVLGTLSLKLSSMMGKLTAKAVLQQGTLSLSAATWGEGVGDGTMHATLTAPGGTVLELYLRQNRMWGTLAGGALGSETLTLDGARNRFAERADLAAQSTLGQFRGYYTVALPIADQLSLGSANAAPQGSGYLTVTVGNGGSAKIAGVLADGTKVSQASRLILFEGCGTEACVPFFVPLYGKQGWAGGLLWIAPETRTVSTDWSLGWLVRWEKPGMGPDGFSELLYAYGGYYSASAALAANYVFGIDATSATYYTSAGWAAPVVYAAQPWGVPVDVSGNRLVMARGVKPVLSGGYYDYSGMNCAMTTWSFMAGTGIFKGKLNLYFDYEQGGVLQHKTLSVPYAGVLTPLRDPTFAAWPTGKGYCLVPETDPALSVYRLKRSFNVVLMDAP